MLEIVGHANQPWGKVKGAREEILRKQSYFLYRALEYKPTLFGEDLEHYSHAPIWINAPSESNSKRVKNRE